MTPRRPVPPPWLVGLENSIAADLRRMMADGVFNPVASAIRRVVGRGRGFPVSRVVVVSGAFVRRHAADSLRWRGHLAVLGVSDDEEMDSIGGFGLHRLTGACRDCRGTGIVYGRGGAEPSGPDFKEFVRELLLEFGKPKLRKAIQDFYGRVSELGRRSSPSTEIPYRLEFRAERMGEAVSLISDGAFIFGARKGRAELKLPPPVAELGEVSPACRACGGCGLVYERMAVTES